jgi:hypothetical protein
VPCGPWLRYEKASRGSAPAGGGRQARSWGPLKGVQRKGSHMCPALQSTVERVDLTMAIVMYHLGGPRMGCSLPPWRACPHDPDIKVEIITDYG